MNNPNNVLIRLMKEKDISTVVQTFDFPWNSAQTTAEKWQRYFSEQQEKIRSIYLIELNGRIAGHGTLLYSSEYPDFKNAQIPEINDVWVLQEMRNKGLGKKLILHLEDIAKKEGYKKIGIGVGLYRDYGPAQILYFQLGYSPDGKGITYKDAAVFPGQSYPVDDDLILWLHKSL